MKKSFKKSPSRTTVSEKKSKFHRPPNNTKTKTKSAAAAAAGYAYRHSFKSQKEPHGSAASLGDDVYEYAPDASRRSKVTLALDREEAREYGVASDGNEDMVEDGGATRARLIGENVDGEMIDSGDDEDIDSDGAFDESDEDRFAGFFSAKVGLVFLSFLSFPFSIIFLGREKSRSKSGNLWLGLQRST